MRRVRSAIAWVLTVAALCSVVPVQAAAAAGEGEPLSAWTLFADWLGGFFGGAQAAEPAPSGETPDDPPAAVGPQPEPSPWQQSPIMDPND